MKQLKHTTVIAFVGVVLVCLVTAGPAGAAAGTPDEQLPLVTVTGEAGVLVVPNEVILPYGQRLQTRTWQRPSARTTQWWRG